MVGKDSFKNVKLKSLQTISKWKHIFFVFHYTFNTHSNAFLQCKGFLDICFYASVKKSNLSFLSFLDFLRKNS